jgi:biotin synthase
MRELAQRLVSERRISADEFRVLIDSCDSPTLDYLREESVRIARQRFELGIFVRGLIEISSFCRNDCRYCGLRCSNRSAERYRLSHDEIMACCEEGYRAGLRTFVLQGGEDPRLTDEWLEELVLAICKRYQDVAITLSLGERSRASYERLFKAGASRYLLRHEAADRALYNSLHPTTMSHSNRIACIENLKDIGYQTGMGMMIGVKGQTTESLVEDLLLMERIQPQMIGIGPFIPHPDTPLGGEPAGDLRLTLLMLSIVRLMHPDALIPATTALATLSAEGRKLGILSGANVVMPNLTPSAFRAKYAIYKDKASFGSEAVEGLQELERELNEIGYHIDYSRGDFQKYYDNE